MTTVQNSNIEFTGNNIGSVFKTLTSCESDLDRFFNNYLFETYGDDLTQILDYLDIAEISRFVVEKFKAQKVDFLAVFFSRVESILTHCDTYVDNLIVVGLFEGIQNSCGLDIDYYYGFDKWLQPISKSKWGTLIDSWEGQEWRNKKEKR